MKARVNLSSREHPNIQEVDILCRIDAPQFHGFYYAEHNGQIIKIDRNQILPPSPQYANNKKPDDNPANSNPS